MGRGAWWATVHEVTKNQTRLSNFTFPKNKLSTHKKEEDTGFIKLRKVFNKSMAVSFLRVAAQ